MCMYVYTFVEMLSYDSVSDGLQLLIKPNQIPPTHRHIDLCVRNVRVKLVALPVLTVFNNYFTIRLKRPRICVRAYLCVQLHFLPLCNLYFKCAGSV